MRLRAQDYILEYFKELKTRRNQVHLTKIRHITEAASYYYNTRPHPADIEVANAELKHGINEDWRASVQRYPEVLEYYYGLVDLSLPDLDDIEVREPLLSTLREPPRKVRYRRRRDREDREDEEDERRR